MTAPARPAAVAGEAPHELQHERVRAAPAGVPAMPDFVRPRRGARHTIDTALRALRAVGFDDARVVVESAGAGWAPGAVVHQTPEPGAPLTGRTRVVLGVAGVGALEALPYALRDVDESAFGVDPLMALLDNPVYKLLHHLRKGGEFFALRPDDPVSARRWIEQVFQIDPTPWAPSRWPALATFLPVLHRAAGREAGLALALRLVFGLRLANFALERAVVPTPQAERFALGVRAARLGVDAMLGDGRAEVARLAVTIGPVSLETYRAHEGPTLAAERRALYELVVPTSLAVGLRERWIVGDPDTPARLGEAAPAPARGVELRAAALAALGLTTRLGPTA